VVSSISLAGGSKIAYILSAQVRVHNFSQQSIAEALPKQWLGIAYTIVAINLVLNTVFVTAMLWLLAHEGRSDFTRWDQYLVDHARYLIIWIF
jgi:hypothetical protein